MRVVDVPSLLHTPCGVAYQVIWEDEWGRVMCEKHCPSRWLRHSGKNMMLFIDSILFDLYSNVWIWIVWICRFSRVLMVNCDLHWGKLCIVFPKTSDCLSLFWHGVQRKWKMKYLWESLIVKKSDTHLQVSLYHILTNNSWIHPTSAVQIQFYAQSALSF